VIDRFSARRMVSAYEDVYEGLSETPVMAARDAIVIPAERLAEHRADRVDVVGSASRRVPVRGSLARIRESRGLGYAVGPTAT
jgi:hypothetical protein